MNNFKNAYEAACVISELVEFVGHRSIGLAISNAATIINNEIDNVPFELVRHDEILQKRIKQVSDLAYFIAAAGHVLAREKEAHLLDGERFHRQASALFRCVCDIQNDLNDQERSDWADMNNHWDIAANALRKLNVLRDEQEELVA